MLSAAAIDLTGLSLLVLVVARRKSGEINNKSNDPDFHPCWGHTRKRYRFSRSSTIKSATAQNFTLILHENRESICLTTINFLSQNNFHIFQAFNRPFKITSNARFLLGVLALSVFNSRLAFLFFSLSQHKFHVYASLSICFVALMDLPFFFSSLPYDALLK